MKRSVCALFVILAVALFGFGPAAFAQATIPSPPAPPTPPDLTVPPWPPRPSVVTNAPVPVITPRPNPMTAVMPQITPGAPLPGAPGPLPPSVLAWDAELKEATIKTGEAAAQFVFNFTNVSSGDLTINYVQTSCGCTAAQLPPLPWKIAAGEKGHIPITMTVAGKVGAIFKTLTVNTDKGWKMLTVKATIQPPDPAAMTANDRNRNQLLAKADRQAVFKGDCARCHVEPVIGKMGKELYTSACGICHEGEHRAAMVPNLHALTHDTNAEYWKAWIAHGKVGSLMPAFAQSEGGPLSEQQITSLVDYLVSAIPAKPGAPAATLPTTAAAAH